MTKLAILVATVLISVVGTSSSLFVVPRQSLTIGYAAWHIWPYALLAVLALIQPRFAYVWLGAAAFMAIVDTWVLGETLLGTSSPVLMMAGMLAALKPLVLLPIGALLGGFLHWYLGRAPT
jgi:hypothetical protein